MSKIVVWIDTDAIIAEPGRGLPLSGQRLSNQWNFDDGTGDGHRIAYLVSLGFTVNPDRRKRDNGTVYIALTSRNKTTPNMIPVDWVVGNRDPLCPADVLFGEITSWDSAGRFTAPEYDAVVPNGIKGANGTLTWRDWRAPNQEHWYDSVNDRYYVPSYSLDGEPLRGTECRVQEDIAGVNVVGIEQLRQMISDGDVVPVHGVPVPTIAGSSTGVNVGRTRRGRPDRR